jgi:hypothetical protein
VVERGYRSDAGRQQRIDQAVVEPDAARLDPAGATGLDAWPGNREPVRTEAELPHDADVLLPPVVMVVRDVAVVARPGATRRVAEGVPDGGAAPVLVDRSFDLVSSGCDPPQDVGRNRIEVHVDILPCLGFGLERSGTIRSA